MEHIGAKVFITGSFIPLCVLCFTDLGSINHRGVEKLCTPLYFSASELSAPELPGVRGASGSCCRIHTLVAGYIP